MKLVRHSFYNLLGLGLPLIGAIFSIPILIKELGEAQFGLLTLIWAVVSYFGLFDLGLGRALTQQLVTTLEKKEQDSIGPLIATASVIMAGLGTFAGILMAVSAEPGVRLIHSVSDQEGVIRAVFWMAAALPAIVITSGFRGILEAKHEFKIINLIRLPMGLFTFLGPVVVVLYFSPQLDLITAVLSVGRVLACLVHAWYALQTLPQVHRNFSFKRKFVKPLLVSGGWMTISNVISPFMGYVDRFMIGVMISTTAVTYYTTPQEIVTKLWIVPGALTAVLFPTFAAQVINGREETRELFNKAVFWLFLTLLPVTVFIALFSNEIISVWIKSEFAQNSSFLLQIFSVGIFLNCLAHIPFTLIQGVGAPRATALIQTAELPLFLIALWWMIFSYGLVGAALAWLLRTVLDMLLMFVICSRLQGWSVLQLINFRTIALSILAAIAFSGIMFEMLSIRIAFVIMTAIFSAVFLVFSQFSGRPRFFGD